MNMQPSQAEAGFDMRLPPEVDADALEKLITEEWAPASHNLSVHVRYFVPDAFCSNVDKSFKSQSA